MGFSYCVGEHVGKGMMVQTLEDGIIKLKQFVAY
jgi:hypothetical protein